MAQPFQRGARVPVGAILLLGFREREHLQTRPTQARLLAQRERGNGFAARFHAEMLPQPPRPVELLGFPARRQ